MVRTAALALTLLACWPAVAQTEPQHEALNHVAIATALARRCPSLEVDLIQVSTLFLQSGIQSADIGPGGRFHTNMVVKTAEARGFVGKYSDAETCQRGTTGYGSEGAVVRGLLKAKL